MTSRILLCALLLAAGLAGAADAAAPKPKKPIDIDRFLGRWHEIVRTPNDRQKGCHAAFGDWTRQRNGKIVVVNTCRKGSPTGPAEVTRASLTRVNEQRALIELNFFAGVIKQEYWILDRADDYSWAIMGTPGGNYVWIFSRKPNPSITERNRLIDRVRALGYNIDKLEVVRR